MSLHNDKNLVPLTSENKIKKEKPFSKDLDSNKEIENEESIEYEECSALLPSMLHLECTKLPFPSKSAANCLLHMKCTTRIAILLQA